MGFIDKIWINMQGNYSKVFKGIERSTHKWGLLHKCCTNGDGSVQIQMGMVLHKWDG